MKKRLPSVLKIMLAVVSWSFVAPSIAADANYKYEKYTPVTNERVTIPARKFYKGEIDSNAYAASAATGEGKYSGKLFTGDLYRGEIQAPDYAPARNRSLHDGFYIGLEAGYDAYEMNNSVNIIQNGSSVFQQNPQLNASGPSYTIVGGFGRYFDDPLYIGTELFYNYPQVVNTSQNVGVSVNGVSGIYHMKSEILSTYGLGLMPGIRLGDYALFYIKGGYTRLDVKTYETLAAAGVNNAQSNGVNGFHVGVGLEADICRNWSVRGEYTHSGYKNFKTAVGTTVTPSDNQFMLGLILHFV